MATSKMTLRDRIELGIPLTYEEAAEFTHRSIAALRNEVWKGNLKPISKSGRLLLFSIPDLRAIMGLTPDMADPVREESNASEKE